MFVLTVDQRGSRKHGDRVPELLSELDRWAARRATGADTFALPFARTAGDEVQGVLATATDAVGLALHLQRLELWSVGIGAGQTRLAGTPGASSGTAFVHAREAVERARTRRTSVPLAVTGEDERAAGEVEALLQLLGALVRRRSDAGWEVVDLLATVPTQRAVADALGITPQAVSQRVAAALWDEEQALHPLAARLLDEAGSVR